MGKKKGNRDKGVVYSTNPNYEYEEEREEEETLPNKEQKLYVELDKKQRGGKKVTLVSGFVGTEEDCKELGKDLKKFCGVGGSTKDFEILVQGDCREKVMKYLEKEGYSAKKRGG